MKNEATIYIVEDDQAVADALGSLFESVQLPTKHFTNGNDFLAQFNPNKKGCILLDVRMPGMSGLDLQQQLKQQHNSLPIIFITGHGDIAMAVRAMKAGAFDFITKPFNSQELLDQVQRAIALTPPPTVNDEIKKNLASLTAREQQILSFIVNGKTSKEIAHELSIAISTVEMHRSNLMRKLQAKTVVELIKNYLPVIVTYGKQ